MMKKAVNDYRSKATIYNKLQLCWAKLSKAWTELDLIGWLLDSLVVGNSIKWT